MNKIPKIDKKIFKMYFYKKRMAIVFLSLIILIGTLIASITPFLFGTIIDLIIKGQFKKILSSVTLMFIIEIICATFSLVENYYGSQLTTKISNDIKKDVINKIIFMGMDNIDKYPKGELINRLEGDSNEIVSTYIGFLTGILQILVNGIVSIIFAFSISIPLTIISVIFIPTLYFGSIIFKNILQKRKMQLKIFNDKYMGFISEVFQNFEGIKSYCFENKILIKITDMYKENINLSKKMFLIQGNVSLIQNILNIFFDCFILLIAGMLIGNRQMSVGNFVSFNQYIGRLFQSSSQVIKYIMSLISCQVNIDRIMSFFDEKTENIKLENIKPDIKDNIDDIISIKVDSLVFKYSNKIILNNLNLEINKSGLYSIVGVNGSGKSTLLKIFLKLYEFQDGHLYINGKDFNTFSAYQIRNEISYIAKEPFLLNDTIEYNLTLGENVKDKHLHDVCSQVGLLDFINDLDAGFNTCIGEKGVTLSSGTKQKISIARALIKNSSLWLCDEITSDLDGKVESDILYLLKRISKSKIIILVSHKLSTIETSDNIFLLNNKKIIANGKNEYLMNTNMLYRELFTCNLV